MLYFSEREKLADLYHKWRKENNVLDCAASVIGFLIGCKLMDCDAAKEYIHKNEKSHVTTLDMSPFIGFMKSDSLPPLIKIKNGLKIYASETDCKNLVKRLNGYGIKTRVTNSKVGWSIYIISGAE